MEKIEVRNETDAPILASACRSYFSGRLYVHVGKCHGGEVVVAPKMYEIIEVHSVPV